TIATLIPGVLVVAGPSLTSISKSRRRFVFGFACARGAISAEAARPRMRLRSIASGVERLERAKGIEPSSVAWEATALPLSYARILSQYHSPSLDAKALRLSYRARAMHDPQKR